MNITNKTENRVDTNNPITAVLDKGKLQVGFGYRYLSTIDSYNHCFTRFFALIRGRAIQVHFGNKVYTVDKKSYKQALYKLTGSENIFSFDFLSVIKNCENLPTSLPMQEILSLTARRKLNRKLQRAIKTNSVEKIKNLLLAGADLEQEYAIGRYSSFCSRFWPNFDPSIQVYYQFKATPLLHAAYQKNSPEVIDLLLQAGANPDAIGFFQTLSQSPNKKISFSKTRLLTSEPLSF